MAELAYGLTASDEERLDQAEALVRAFCGWHIAPSVDVVDGVVRGTGDGVLLLPSLYVTEVTTVTDGTSSVLVVEDDYTWTSAGVLTRVGWWPAGELVTVSYTHGYGVPPPDVTAVVQAVAQRAVSNPGSLVRQQIGPFAETYSTTGAGQVAVLSLLDSEKETLRRYRIPRGGLMQTETVTRLRGTPEADPYSTEDVNLDWAAPGSVEYTTLAPAEPRPSTETPELARNAVVAGYTLYLPPDADVTAQDRMTVRGETYDVMGDPAGWADIGLVVQVGRKEG